MLKVSAHAPNYSFPSGKKSLKPYICQCQQKLAIQFV